MLQGILSKEVVSKRSVINLSRQWDPTCQKTASMSSLKVASMSTAAPQSAEQNWNGVLRALVSRNQMKECEGLSSKSDRYHIEFTPLRKNNKVGQSKKTCGSFNSLVPRVAYSFRGNNMALNGCLSGKNLRSTELRSPRNFSTLGSVWSNRAAYKNTPIQKSDLTNFKALTNPIGEMKKMRDDEMLRSLQPSKPMISMCNYFLSNLFKKEYLKNDSDFDAIEGPPIRFLYPKLREEPNSNLAPRPATAPPAVLPSKLLSLNLKYKQNKVRRLSTCTPRLMASKKGGRKKKSDQACGGCAQVEDERKKALEPKNRPKPFLNCKMRSGGKCKAEWDESKKVRTNPYLSNKSFSVSPCNKPRKAPPKPFERELPCDKDKH